MGSGIGPTKSYCHKSKETTEPGDYGGERMMKNRTIRPGAEGERCKKREEDHNGSNGGWR